MIKINFQVLMMLLALLFSEAVSASENLDTRQREGLMCFLGMCNEEGPPLPEPRSPESIEPKPASKTTTEKS
jgi:hypothetical protein